MTIVEAPRRPRVLAIDDDVLIGRAIARMLRACDVTIETDPLAAAQRFERHDDFDLILCDLYMPRLGGADLLVAAREVAPRLAERVVVMTGGTTSGDDERFLRRCGARVLLKPFTKEELEDLVAWALERQDLA